MLTRPSVVVRASHKNFVSWKPHVKSSKIRMTYVYTVRTTFWKFELLIENSHETSTRSTKSRATFQAALRQHHWYFEDVKTMAASKIHGQFIQVSFPSKICFFHQCSLKYIEIRQNSLSLLLHNTVTDFSINTCTLKWNIS